MAAFSRHATLEGRDSLLDVFDDGQLLFVHPASKHHEHHLKRSVQNARNLSCQKSGTLLSARCPRAAQVLANASLVRRLRFETRRDEVHCLFVRRSIGHGECIVSCVGAGPLNPALQTRGHPPRLKGLIRRLTSETGRVTGRRGGSVASSARRWTATALRGHPTGQCARIFSP